MNKYAKELLTLDRNALRGLNAVFGFDFEKPYTITKTKGKFTINRLLKELEAEGVNLWKSEIALAVSFGGSYRYRKEKIFIVRVSAGGTFYVDLKEHRYIHGFDSKIDTFYAKCDFEAERKRQEEEKRLAKEEEERRERERKAKSQYVGEIGDKIDLDVVLEKRAWFEVKSFSGFGTETMHVYTFRDDHGNALVWKTTSGTDAEAGTTVHLKGTIKEHTEYNEEKQTVLTRCRVTQQEGA